MSTEILTRARHVCSVAECGGKVHGHGWCQKHYTRWRTTGDPITVKRPLGLPPEQRFWEKVDRRGQDECWPWLGGRGPAGHGWFSVKSVDILAHRWLWRHLHGPIPEGLVVRHSCDNPPCCNPAHLLIGTQLDNITDRETRGRTAKGSSHYRAKLTESDVREIREGLRGGVSRTALAQHFGVSRATIRQVGTGQSWKHVNDVTTA